MRRPEIFIQLPTYSTGRIFYKSSSPYCYQSSSQCPTSEFIAIRTAGLLFPSSPHHTVGFCSGNTWWACLSRYQRIPCHFLSGASHKVFEVYFTSQSEIMAEVSIHLTFKTSRHQAAQSCLLPYGGQESTPGLSPHCCYFLAQPYLTKTHF